MEKEKEVGGTCVHVHVGISVMWPHCPLGGWAAYLLCSSPQCSGKATVMHMVWSCNHGTDTGLLDQTKSVSKNKWWGGSGSVCVCVCVCAHAAWWPPREELLAAAVFLNEGQFVGGESLVLIDVAHRGHQRTDDDLGVVLEEVDLREGKGAREREREGERGRGRVG